MTSSRLRTIDFYMSIAIIPVVATDILYYRKKHRILLYIDTYLRDECHTVMGGGASVIWVRATVVGRIWGDLPLVNTSHHSYIKEQNACIYFPIGKTQHNIT